MTDFEQYDSIQVFVGVDVGKGAHHAVALDRKGRRLLDRALPNDETKLRALIGKLKEHGSTLLVVDQPATVGALPVAAARDEGVLVAYLPGLAMRRIANLHAGEASRHASLWLVHPRRVAIPTWKQAAQTCAVPPRPSQRWAIRSPGPTTPAKSVREAPQSRSHRARTAPL